MALIEPDSVMGRPVPLDVGERIVTEFRPHPSVYWRSHFVMAVVLGALAGTVLVWQANPYPAMGPLGAAIAIAARAAFVKSEAMAEVWRLTDRRLLGPASRAIPLAQLQTARPFLGAVQVITTTGDKHLIKYQSDPTSVSASLIASRRTP